MDLPTLEFEPSGDFIKSFDISDATGIKAHFDKYGFVAIKDVLTQEECDLTLDEFWETGKPQGLDRANPDTWKEYWERQRFGRMGIIGGWSNLESLRQLENRQNPKVYNAFSIVLGDEKLWVDHDRLGIMRPAKHDPEAQTLKNWLHLDCNPIAGYASIGGFSDSKEEIDFSKTVIIQGLIGLTDARVEDGGFHCVPGGHKLSTNWAKNNRRCGSNMNMQVPKDDPLHSMIKEIPIRAGTILLWTSLLFHGNHPNSSENFRAVQYIRMMPTTGTPYSPLMTDPRFYNDSFVPTELGRKLFGFDPWTA